MDRHLAREARPLRSRAHAVQADLARQPNRRNVARLGERLPHAHFAVILAIVVARLPGNLARYLDGERLIQDVLAGREPLRDRRSEHEWLERTADLTAALRCAVEGRVEEITPTHQRDDIAGLHFQQNRGALDVARALSRPIPKPTRSAGRSRARRCRLRSPATASAFLLR